MKSSGFYFEIRDLVTQFCSAFDSIIINRYNDNDRTPHKQIRVRYIYSPKSRTLHNIVNKAEHITVPAVSVFPTAISRDNNRVFNKNAGFFIKQSSETDHIPAPIPVNITLSMSIITRYMADMEQILSNFIPYNNPYIIISWKLPPEFSSIGSEIRTEVLWDENISINAPTEMGEGDKFRVTADTSFVIKGWLFKQHPDKKQPNVYTINLDFHPIDVFIDNQECGELPDVETITVSANE